MTDPNPHPQAELDELASAHLDGQTSPEEAQRVLADPTLQARVDRLRRVRDAVRTPDGPVDPARREATIAAALLAAALEPVAVAAPGDDLAAARARRSTRRRWLPLAGVAAAIALAALLVPQLGDDGGPDDTLASKADTFDQRTGEPDRTTEDDDGDVTDPSASAEAGATLEAPSDRGAAPTGGAADSGPAHTGGDSGASTTDGGAVPTTTPEAFTTLATPAGHLVDLGSFEEGEADRLIAAAEVAADEPEATSSARPSQARQAEIDACVAPMETAAREAGAAVLYAAVARVGDETVVGIALDAGGKRELRVRYLDGCERWFEAPLEG